MPCIVHQKFVSKKRNSIIALVLNRISCTCVRACDDRGFVGPCPETDLGGSRVGSAVPGGNPGIRSGASNFVRLAQLSNPRLPEGFSGLDLCPELPIVFRYRGS